MMHTPQPPYQFKSIAKGIGISGFRKNAVKGLTEQKISYQSLPYSKNNSDLPEKPKSRLYPVLFKLSMIINTFRHPRFHRYFNLLRILAIDLIVVLLFICTTLISASILVRAIYHKDSVLIAIKTLPSFWEELSLNWLAIPVLTGILLIYGLTMRLIAGRTIGEIIFPESNTRAMNRHS